MQAPDDYTVAGWYVHAPTPGERGPAIIAGHLDSRRGPAVFYRLHELRPGDEITIARQDHSITVFEVERVERRSKDAFPTSEVYGDIDHAGLRLITCGGAFDRSSGHYHDDVIVYARLRRAIQGVGDAVSTSAAAQVGRAPRAP